MGVPSTAGRPAASLAALRALEGAVSVITNVKRSC